MKDGEPSFTILYSRCVHLGCPVQPNGPIDEENMTQINGVELRPRQRDPVDREHEPEPIEGFSGLGGHLSAGRYLEPGIDVLIALGTTMAYAYSAAVVALGVSAEGVLSRRYQGPFNRIESLVLLRCWRDLLAAAIW